MLILSRKLGESIIINDDITVILIEIIGKQVKLGINAPNDISVHREEVYLKLKADKEREPDNSLE